MNVTLRALLVSSFTLTSLAAAQSPPRSLSPAQPTSAAAPRSPTPASSETIGPWFIEQAPITATEIVTGGSSWGWLNIVNAAATVEEAFSDFPMLDDGYANAMVGTTVEVVFATPVVNEAGDDLVILEARFDAGGYAVSTDFDSFTFELDLATTDFIDSGTERTYFYQFSGGGPFDADIWGAAFDLDDLGVPSGSSVTRIRFITRNDACDPIGVGELGELVTSYCTAKSGLTCGVPEMGFSGSPEAGAVSGFTVSAARARGMRNGWVLYSCAGRAAIPFQGGLLCVNPAPLRQTPSVSSGGSPGACDGVFSMDFNAFASGNGGGNPDACLSIVGQQVNAQWWGRDSLATGSFLSDALEFSM